MTPSDLEELLQLIEDNNIEKPENSEDLGELEPFAVAFRYDFLDEPSLFDREKALAIVRRVRTWAEIQISKYPSPAGCIRVDNHLQG